MGLIQVVEDQLPACLWTAQARLQTYHLPGSKAGELERRKAV